MSQATPEPETRRVWAKEERPSFQTQLNLASESGGGVEGTESKLPEVQCEVSTAAHDLGALSSAGFGILHSL